MSIASAKSLNILPRLSEKGYALSQNRVYVVEVDLNMNKHSVARAIESQFEVKVSTVNILNVRGKVKRSVSKQGRRISDGRDKNFKKAYVTLAEGQSLPFYQAIEEEEQKAEKVQERLNKEVEKKSKSKRGVKKADKE